MTVADAMLSVTRRQIILHLAFFFLKKEGLWRLVYVVYTIDIAFWPNDVQGRMADESTI